MAMPLTAADFPLYSIGPNVYRKTESSPMFTAMDDALASDLAFRLNAQEMAHWSWPREHAGDSVQLVFGRAP